MKSIDPIDYKFYMNFLYDKSSKSFCKALEQVIEKFLTKPHRNILLIINNVFIHRSKYTTEFLKNIKKVEIFPSPPTYQI